MVLNPIHFSNEVMFGWEITNLRSSMLIEFAVANMTVNAKVFYKVTEAVNCL
jgi:hypothetical protein